MRFGVHCSLKHGFSGVLIEAEEKGCEAMQIFTRSPRMWRMRIINNHLQLDINGNIEILEMFWKNATEINSNSEGMGTAYPLLVYADLMATADSRNREIAKQIYDQYLANINN